MKKSFEMLKEEVMKKFSYVENLIIEDEDDLLQFFTGDLDYYEYECLEDYLNTHQGYVLDGIEILFEEVK